ncbi:MAG: flap endonuclease-1 [Candidatus Nanohaloarchaea archaeon]
MGVDLGELVEPEEIEFADLNDREVAIDAMNTMYQFLSIIRQRDGTPLKDSDGNVTSHLSGLFYRTINLLENNIRPVYVFDGAPPDLKAKEAKERRKKREEAREEWKRLKEEGKISEAYSKATQSSKLSGEMIAEAQKLLDAMGVPYVEAPSEGEAQAAYMSKNSGVYAVGSQDWDCLLFGADVMVRNLTSRKTRKTSSGKRKEVKQQRIRLEQVLEGLGLERRQLVMLGLLMGTDFNEGVHGIGPKKGLELAKKHRSIDSLVEDEGFEWRSENDPEAVYSFFMDPPVKDVEFSFSSPDKERIREVLVEKHDFSRDRIDSKLEDLNQALNSRQSGLGSFT